MSLWFFRIKISRGFEGRPNELSAADRKTVHMGLSEPTICIIVCQTPVTLKLGKIANPVAAVFH